MTPEGRVKAKVKRALAKLPRCYAFWPVQTGMGAATLDCLLCVNGWFVSIETKRKGSKPTARQEQTIKKMKEAGALVYIVDDEASLLYAIKDIEEKCYPTYSCQQQKDANGIVRISPLVLSRRQ